MLPASGTVSCGGLAIAPLKNAGKDWTISDVVVEALEDWLNKPENRHLVERHRLVKALENSGLSTNLIADRGWLVSTSELAPILGLKSLNGAEFERYGFRFVRSGKNGSQSAWRVEKAGADV
ncbi:MAG: hypothetical protein VKK04_04465 [Synechococcales bacterium]|nr:hypothetical protein [Synechococcales bacterium]